MTGPGARPGHLRAAHADREQAIDMIKDAFARGLVTRHEFDLRVGRALVSRTYADLAAVTAGLPACGQPAYPPIRPLTRAEKAAACGLYGIILPAMFTAVAISGHPAAGVVLAVAAVVCFTFWMNGAAMLIASRYEKRLPG